MALRQMAIEGELVLKVIIVAAFKVQLANALGLCLAQLVNEVAPLAFKGVFILILIVFAVKIFLIFLLFSRLDLEQAHEQVVILKRLLCSHIDIIVAAVFPNYLSFTLVYL